MKYTIKRNGLNFFQHEFRGARTQSAPAVDFVDIEFDYSEAILLKNNDTIEFDGQTYYCDKQYNSVLKKSTNLYNHRARFLSSNYKATNIALKDPQGLHVFEIEGNLLTLLTLAVNRLNAMDSGWSYNTPPTTVTKTFQIDGMNVMEFLARVSSEFEIPFYVQDKVIYYKDPALVDGGDFEYGKGNGFIDIRKSYKSGEKIPNTVYASGGDSLVLDAPVVNNGDVATNGVIEGFYSNENIKPTTRVYMEGVVTADNVVTTTQINYDIQAQKIAGQTPLINFETGALGGLSFYITNSTYDTNTNVTVIYLRRRTEAGVLKPNNTIRALAGDYFNITNIRQPQAIIDEALFKLGQYATADMNNRILNNMGIEANLDPLFPEDLKLNDSITVVDDNLELAGRFFILEIKTDLQNLNKKDLVLGRYFRYLNIPGLNVKNDNIIDLGIQNNYDDIVKVEGEVVGVKNQINEQLIIIGQIDHKVGEIDLSVENIKVVELPKKEDNSNRINILEVENPTPFQYPNAISVKQGLDLKQNKLTPASNVSIVNDVISVKVNNTVQNVGANSVTNTANKTYSVQNDAGGQLVVNVPWASLGLGTANGLQLSNNVLSLGLSSASTNGSLSSSDWNAFNNKLDANDLDGFVYNATYNTSTHVLTLFRQNAPNVVIDFPTEDLIANIDVVGNDLVITFQDGTTKSIPLNTLLVGVVKSVNGLTPNSNGEIVLQITDIPNLSSELGNKLDIRMTGLVSNLTQPEKDVILGKLGVTSNVTQVLSLNSNTISLSGGGGSVSLGIVNIGGLQTALDGKANTSGYYSGLHVGLADNAIRWNGQEADWTPNSGTWLESLVGLDNNTGKASRYTPTQVSNWLGINISWNLQQVVQNGNTSTLEATFAGVKIGHQTGGFLGFDSTKDYAFLNSATSAGRILTGGLLASNDYADASLIPANGIYSKGNIRTSDTVQIGGGLLFDRPSEVQDWSVYQNNGGINFYVTGGSLTADVLKIAENGRLTTLLDGTSADWNAKVSQSQLANYVDVTTQNQIINSTKIFLTQATRPAIEIQGNGSNLFPKIEFHQPNQYLASLEMRNNGLLYWDNEILASRNWVVNNFASNAALGNYVNKAGDTMSGDLGILSSNYEIMRLNSTNSNNYVSILIGQDAINLGFYQGVFKNQSTPLNSFYHITSYGQAEGSMFKMLANGNIGINETNPQAKLHVNGNIITDNATASNHAVAFGQLSNYALLSQVYTQSQALALFVGLNGVQTIADTKTFTSSPIVPNGTLSSHAVNKSQLDAVAASIPNPANNGLLTISTSADLTGGGTFSADQATASNVDIGLSASTLASLALANTAVQPSALNGYVPTSRTLTINGTTFDLSQNRAWTIPIPAQVNITQGAGISVTGTYPNLTIANTAPNVQSDWNATSGLAQILNKPTIPTVGNGQLSFTAPTGLSVTGAFNANQSVNTVVPINWQAGYQGFTTAESNKLAGIQAGATVPNNGVFTVQGINSLVGGASTSADTALNTIAQLDLAQTTKDEIQQGVHVYNEFPSVKEGGMVYYIDNITPVNIPIEKKKTIINVAEGLIGVDIAVGDAPYEGYELAINGFNEWDGVLRGNVQNRYRVRNNIPLSSGSMLFWWITNEGGWVQAI